MVIGKQMYLFGARANQAKTLLYCINGGVDEKLKIQVGPKVAPIMDEVLHYYTVMASLDNFMDWLAVQYISALNLIHYMHDKYSYEAIPDGAARSRCLPDHGLRHCRSFGSGRFAGVHQVR